MKKYLLIICSIFIFIFSFNLVNDHRERDLDDLIKYRNNDFHSIGFTKDLIPEGHAFEWWTEDEMAADELIQFLSQYQVVKINEEDYHSRFYEKSESFHFTIQHKEANPVILDVRDDVVHLYTGNYYEIVNGPVDMGWIHLFHLKYLEKYGSGL